MPPNIDMNVPIIDSKAKSNATLESDLNKMASLLVDNKVFPMELYLHDDRASPMEFDFNKKIPSRIDFSLNHSRGPWMGLEEVHADDLAQFQINFNAPISYDDAKDTDLEAECVDEDEDELENDADKLYLQAMEAILSGNQNDATGDEDIVDEVHGDYLALFQINLNAHVSYEDEDDADLEVQCIDKDKDE